MKKRNILSVIAAMMLITVVVLACSKYKAPASNSPSSTPISIKSSGYSNANLKISMGSSVTWRNDDSVAHTVTADNGNFDSGDIMAGGTYSYTFPSAGTFTYHDKHNSMATGVVTVTNASSGGY